MESEILHPIPEGSVITEEDVVKCMSMLMCERDAAIGSLVMWEKGQGEMSPTLAEAFPAIHIEHIAAKPDATKPTEEIAE